jgi:hypothetical protein
MRSIYWIAATIGIIALAAMPVQAFTAKELTISVARNGDAKIGMTYDLSWPEQIGLFIHAADPQAELKKGLENGLQRPITVSQVDRKSAEVFVTGFASTTWGADGSLIMSTPGISLEKAQNEVKRNPVVMAITMVNSIDLTPKRTIITFPDGQNAVYTNQINIPPVTHTVAA